MLAGAIAALISSLILNLILPAVLGVLLASLVSGLTILDPLYAGERVEATWGILKTILIFQTLHTFITAPASGSLIGLLQRRIQSRWLYLAGAGLTVILHYLFLGVFIAISSFFPSPGSVAGTSIFIVTLAGPFIGLISVYSVRRWGRQTMATTP
jgi:hypothetical protein